MRTEETTMRNIFKSTLSAALFFGGTVLTAAETSLSSLPLDNIQVGWGKVQADRSITGKPLSVGGQIYTKGLGLHSPGLLVLQLDGQATQFRCQVAIDDDTKGRGTVELKFYGNDKKLLHATGMLRGGQPATPVTIDLTGQKTLVVEITDGGDNYSNDHLDLLDPVVIHNGAAPVIIGGAAPAAVIELPPGPGELVIEVQGVAAGKDDRLAQVIRELQRKFPARAAEGERQLQELGVIQKEMAAAQTAAAAGERYLALRRQVMLGNPLIPSQDLLFVKRDVCPPVEKMGNHMCDQYFGFNAVTDGAGLFILENAFSAQPKLRNLLENAVCGNGRYQGRKLTTGAVMTPDLSFDGKTVLFAYTEAQHENGKNLDARYKWTEDSTWHIFKINVDGTGLTQLTDGAYNDFSPCWMPNGRIMFISERRGGFVRCGFWQPIDFGRCHGRPVPTYTLHAMQADGSKLTCLSWHETNEWHPSVNNEGMIIYTRWDYVDRGFNQAHHPWITTPDGRNPRIITGNYRDKESDGPCMEMNIRAVPNSTKYVATAAPHHGQAYGSLILIDPNIADDNKLAQLKLLTPEARFPESTCKNNTDWKYATAWPLDEEWYLCVHDPEGKAVRGPKNNFAITLLHAPTGLKQEIYRDPGHSCLSPMPLCARKTPPIVPDASEAFADPKTRTQIALFGIANIYDSYIPFPKDIKIKELRIIQIIPKTTPSANVPRIGWGSQKPARGVLGTVPVEEDGSVYFELPACTPVYFQAIDEHGLAWQSMRSSTYAQPGERLTCAGCHEPRVSAPIRVRGGAAFRRAPSKILPDVAGSRPFSYPILVQPVLDKNCVACHQKNAGKKAPDLGRGEYLKNEHQWHTSYLNLRHWSFHYDDPKFETARTVPGKFGARASKLWQLLEKGHHDVKLTPEEMHRLTLWLDCNSDFFGAYENTADQAAGKVVKPKME